MIEFNGGDLVTELSHNITHVISLTDATPVNDISGITVYDWFIVYKHPIC